MLIERLKFSRIKTYFSWVIEILARGNIISIVALFRVFRVTVIMASDADWLGFPKEETKTWNSEFKGLFKSLIRSIYKMKGDGSWILVISNEALANRINDGFAKIHNSQLKSLSLHIDFLDMEPTVKQAWEYLQKTVQNEDWNCGDEILGDEEKDGPAELLVVAIAAKCAVLSFMWDMVQGGSEDGEVPSVSTLSNLVSRLWREQDRASAIKHLSKGLDKAPTSLDFLTALMKGRGHIVPDKLEKSVNVSAEVAAAAQREQELRREIERLKRDKEESRYSADGDESARRQLAQNPLSATPRGGGDGGRGGRGGRGRGGGAALTPRIPMTLRPFTFKNPSEQCDRSIGGCGGKGHLKDKCCGVQGSFVCDRCGGVGHKVLLCPSDFSCP